MPQEGLGPTVHTGWCAGWKGRLGSDRKGPDSEGDWNGFTVPLGHSRFQSVNDSSTVRRKGRRGAETSPEAAARGAAAACGSGPALGREAAAPTAGILLR